MTISLHIWTADDKLVLTREEVNVDGPNLIEGDVAADYCD